MTCKSLNFPDTRHLAASYNEYIGQHNRRGKRKERTQFGGVDVFVCQRCNCSLSKGLRRS
jgi:hypothetical protein